MTDKEIFKEIWAIKDLDIRAERMDELVEQDSDVAARIKTLLRHGDQFQSVLDDPFVFLSSPALKQQTVRYSVKSELAKGGMGVIYTAYDSQMRRDVVLKCLQLKHRNNFQAVQRFYNEAHVTGQLQHPGIAPVYELGELEDGRPFYCMKLVEGETLAQFLADKDSTSVDRARALKFFLQICQTMAFAHERGIIHRDLKPSNIMLGPHGQTQVMDWGVAKKLADTDAHNSFTATQQTLVNLTKAKHNFEPTDAKKLADLTRHGQIVGTPGYMSPEQSTGRNDLIDKQSDVYSLGAILLEILTGSVPDGTWEHSAVQSEPSLSDVSQRSLDLHNDSKLAELALSCLQPEPSDRPLDAGAVAEKLVAYFESRETAAQAAQIKLEKELTRHEEARKRRFSFAICVVACLGLLVAGIVGTTVGFYRENEARTLADQKAEDAQAAKDLAVSAKITADELKGKAEARLTQLTKVNEILSSVFENLHPHKSARSGRPLVDLLVKNLDEATRQLEEGSIGAPDVIASFQTKIGKCYHAFGLNKKAIPLFEKADAFAIAEYGIENKIARNARCRLADSLSSDNQAKRANSLYVDLRDFYFRSDKTDTKEFLRVQYKLASNYLVMGENQKALELIETYSERGLEVIGVEYGLHLAQIYNFNLMSEKAIEVLNDVLSEIESAEIAGAEFESFESDADGINQINPNLETGQMLLARAYIRLAQHRKALPILEKLSVDFDARYGNSPSPRCYIVSLSLARSLQGVGRYRDSIKHLKKFMCLTKGKSQLLCEQRTFALYWLVEAYLKTGDFSNALETATRIHNEEVAKHGACHRATSLSAERLADIYLLINQPEKAKEYLDVAFAKNYEIPQDCQRQRLARKKFKSAMSSACRDGLKTISDELKEVNELLADIDQRAFNVYPVYFDNLEPQIFLAESLALQGNEHAVQLIEEFESRVKERSGSLDELGVPALHFHRACVARYVIRPDETLVLRLKELIELLHLANLHGAHKHMLEEARSLLGMTYLKLGQTAKAKRQLESSFAALLSISNSPPETRQATIDAGKRLMHFYSITNANDESVERIASSIRTIKPNKDLAPPFSRVLIDRTLTTDQIKSEAIRPQADSVAVSEPLE